MSKNNRQTSTTSTTATSANAANRVIPVVFLHPRDGSEFAADIGPTTTGQAAVDGLVQEGFFPAPSESVSYALQLQRTGKSIPLGEVLANVGVTANDRIAVVATQAGA